MIDNISKLHKTAIKFCNLFHTQLIKKYNALISPKITAFNVKRPSHFSKEMGLNNYLLGLMLIQFIWQVNICSDVIDYL